MDIEKLQRIIEAVLLSADSPVSLDQLQALFGDAGPSKPDLKKALKGLEANLEGRAVELKEVANGWRVQVRQDYSEWVAQLWEERPPRYSRALLETLAIICYRQPVTRPEIEEIRGVGVSHNIIKTLIERDWIKIIGHKEVPGRPGLFGTTKTFLDDFGLKTLEDLPSLPEIKDADTLGQALEKLQPTPTELEAAQEEGIDEDETSEMPPAADNDGTADDSASEVIH